VEDVLIIGAGAAGLAAAQTLRRVGQEVTVLEARDRVGGRILTLADPTFPAPLDLGAEFIHGREAAASPWLREVGVVALEGAGEHLLLRRGEVSASGGVFARAAPLLALGASLDADLSFADLLRHPLSETVDADTRELARLLVEGFDAADPEAASSAALAHEWQGGTNEEGAQFRPLGGYGALVASLRRGLAVRLHTVVREVCWGPGETTVTAIRFGEGEVFRARRVLVTLPLSVMQEGAVRFSPSLGKEGALAGLRMGGVIKVVLLFDTAFWEARFPGASYFSAPDAPFPTLWTPDPLRLPLLSAWAGGPKAAALSGLGERELVGAALESVAAFFGPVPAPAAARVYDWQADPYARGAYSYVATGGVGARSRLAAPLGDTLFFAGEATAEGAPGTVHGALESGVRAARELLAVR